MYATTTRPLSDREAQVADGITRGLSYGEIAAELGIACSTVRTYVSAVNRALGTGNRSALIRAYRHTKVAFAAIVMREKTGKLSEAAWRELIVMMLDALDEV
jgi:DNA-binding CsgD family transcriptional regulator